MRVNLVDPPESTDVQEVDEVVAHDAHVHLEDLGHSYMLIIRDESRHLHLEIPKRRRKGSAWILEDLHPDELRAHG